MSLLKKLISKKRLDLFVRDVLNQRVADHQANWFNILADDSYNKIAEAAPRGHLKTTSFSVDFPLWKMQDDHNIRILLVSAAESQSQSFLREIVGHIERNQDYVDFAGQLKPKSPEKWSGREIIITRDKVDLKDPTISTVGVGGTILSKRADIIICDDILNIDNTKTFEQRQKMKDWFHQVLLPVLVPGGRVIVVGTVWQKEDLLHELLADASYDYRNKLQAIISWPERMDLWDEWYRIRMGGTQRSKIDAEYFFVANRDEMHRGVKVLWEAFPFKLLYGLWRSNRVAFEKAYQNNIISREDQRFKEEWLERAKARGTNLRLVKSLTQDQRKEMKVLTQGIDLAAKPKEGADDNANLTLGLRRMDDMFQVLGLERGKYTPALWRNSISDMNDGFLPDKILVESNAYQVSLQMDMAEKNLPIEAFNTGGEKFDPYIGVESLAIIFENDRMILPYDKTDPTTIALIDQLVDELRQFPVGHTGDSAMALWFAYTAMRSIMAKSQGSSGFIQMVQQGIKEIKEAAPATKPSNINAWSQMARRGGTRL